MTKYYRNQRLDDSVFALDFVEIYVIDSKTKSFIPELNFWCGYLFVNIIFKIAMTILLMFRVDVEWLFGSLPMEF